MGSPEYHKAYYLKNKEKLKARSTEVYANNRSEKIAKVKEYKKKNKVKVDAWAREYQSKNRAKIKEQRHSYYQENKVEIVAKQLAYVKLEHVKQRRSKYMKDYYKDPVRSLRRNLQSRLTELLVVKSLKKQKSTIEYLGCSIEKLKVHLEKQFKPGMTWENHTFYGWHIDHVIPCSTAKSEQDLLTLFHYTNLQPLWWWENLSKGAKYEKAS